MSGVVGKVSGMKEAYGFHTTDEFWKNLVERARFYENMEKS